jgi:uncharacterized protein YjaG (DUF416 family)
MNIISNKGAMTMTTQELLDIKLGLNAKSMASSQALNDYCKPFRGTMGLISDECQRSDEYKRLKQQFDTDWRNLRTFNKATSKNKELQRALKADIQQRRQAKLQA